MARRVLVVDDDPSTRSLVAAHFEKYGAHVVEEATARSALSRLEAGAFDLLITDVQMPGPSGLWLLEQVRSRWAALPVIIMTGGFPNEDGTRGHRADGVLFKPFRLSELSRVVEDVLGDR